MIRSVQPNLELLRDPWYVVQVLFSLFAMAVLSWIGSLLAALVLFGALMEDQAKRNGGPFKVGDRVRILAGRNIGKLGAVASYGQGRAVCVKINCIEGDADSGVYSHYQLLREQSAEPVFGHDQTDES